MILSTTKTVGKTLQIRLAIRSRTRLHPSRCTDTDRFYGVMVSRPESLPFQITTLILSTFELMGFGICTVYMPKKCLAQLEGATLTYGRQQFGKVASSEGRTRRSIHQELSVIAKESFGRFKKQQTYSITQNVGRLPTCSHGRPVDSLVKRRFRYHRQSASSHTVEIEIILIHHKLRLNSTHSHVC